MRLAMRDASSIAPEAVEPPKIRPTEFHPKTGMFFRLDKVVPDIDSFWAEAFKKGGRPYEGMGFAMVDQAGITLATNCKHAVTKRRILLTTETVPFYCPLGGTIPGYGNQSHGVLYFGGTWLANRLRAIPSVDFDFVGYTMVAHHLGHHVQHQLLGRHLPPRLSRTWLELGADCFSGVFAHHAELGNQLPETRIDAAVYILAFMENDMPQIFRDDPDIKISRRISAFMTGYRHGNTGECLQMAPLQD